MLDEENHSDEESDAGQDGDYDECPSYWKSNMALRDFDERCDEPERTIKQVQNMFDKTWRSVVTRDRSGPTPVGLKVISVQRIEDRKLWATYTTAKHAIQRKRGGNVGQIAGVKTLMSDSGSRFSGADLDGTVNELYLMHGTSPEGALGISNDGFRMDLSGSNAGNMFGPGAYFAECCSKSDEYAKQGTGIYIGTYAMLLCRVTCGEMFRMLARDDEKVNEAMHCGQYDAVLGDREASVRTYREFVVFRQRQIYPEYVVLYKRVLPDESSSDDG